MSRREPKDKRMGDLRFTNLFTVEVFRLTSSYLNNSKEGLVHVVSKENTTSLNNHFGYLISLTT